jgi:hypothetical protein
MPTDVQASSLWLLDYFRVHGRSVRLGADVACWIGADSGRAAQPFQRNSQHRLEVTPVDRCQRATKRTAAGGSNQGLLKETAPARGATEAVLAACAEGGVSSSLISGPGRGSIFTIPKSLILFCQRRANGGLLPERPRSHDPRASGGFSLPDVLIRS